MPNYDTYRTEPPEGKEAPDLPGRSGNRKTHHKPCGGDVRYTRWDGDWYLECEYCDCMPWVLIEESDLYNPQDEGCPDCGNFVPDELWDDEHGCCVACADKKAEVC